MCVCVCVCVCVRVLTGRPCAISRVLLIGLPPGGDLSLSLSLSLSVCVCVCVCVFDLYFDLRQYVSFGVCVLLTGCPPGGDWGVKEPSVRACVRVCVCVCVCVCFTDWAPARWGSGD